MVPRCYRWVTTKREAGACGDEVEHGAGWGSGGCWAGGQTGATHAAPAATGAAAYGKAAPRSTRSAAGAAVPRQALVEEVIGHKGREHFKQLGGSGCWQGHRPIRPENRTLQPRGPFPRFFCGFPPRFNGLLTIS